MGRWEGEEGGMQAHTHCCRWQSLGCRVGVSGKLQCTHMYCTCKLYICTCTCTCDTIKLRIVYMHMYMYMLASFFLPSHLSLKHVYCISVHCNLYMYTCTCTCKCTVSFPTPRIGIWEQDYSMCISLYLCTVTWTFTCLFNLGSRPSPFFKCLPPTHN